MFPPLGSGDNINYLSVLFSLLFFFISSELWPQDCAVKTPWSILVKKIINDIRHPVAPQAMSRAQRLEELAARYPHFTNELADEASELLDEANAGLNLKPKRTIRLATSDEIEELSQKLMASDEFDPVAFIEVMVQRESLKISDPIKRTEFIVENLNQHAHLVDEIQRSQAMARQSRGLLDETLKPMEGPLGFYRKDAPDISGCLSRTGGNCTARAKTWASIMTPEIQRALMQNQDWHFGVQVFTDHVEPVLYRLKPDGPPETILLVDGSHFLSDLTPIVDPQALAKADLSSLNDPKYYKYGNPSDQVPYTDGNIPDFAFGSGRRRPTQSSPTKGPRGGGGGTCGIGSGLACKIASKIPAPKITIPATIAISALAVTKVAYDQATAKETSKQTTKEEQKQEKEHPGLVACSKKINPPPGPEDVCMPVEYESLLEGYDLLWDQLIIISREEEKKKQEIMRQFAESESRLNFSQFHFWGKSIEETKKEIFDSEANFRNDAAEWLKKKSELIDKINSLRPPLDSTDLIQSKYLKEINDMNISSDDSISEYRKKRCDAITDMNGGNEEGTLRLRSIIENMVMSNTPTENKQWLELLTKECKPFVGFYTWVFFYSNIVESLELAQSKKEFKQMYSHLCQKNSKVDTKFNSEKISSSWEEETFDSPIPGEPSISWITIADLSAILSNVPQTTPPQKPCIKLDSAEAQAMQEKIVVSKEQLDVFKNFDPEIKKFYEIENKIFYNSSSLREEDLQFLLELSKSNFEVAMPTLIRIPNLGNIKGSDKVVRQALNTAGQGDLGFVDFVNSNSHPKQSPYYNDLYKRWKTTNNSFNCSISLGLISNETDQDVKKLDELIQEIILTDPDCVLRFLLESPYLLRGNNLKMARDLLSQIPEKYSTEYLSLLVSHPSFYENAELMTWYIELAQKYPEAAFDDLSLSLDLQRYLYTEQFLQLFSPVKDLENNQHQIDLLLNQKGCSLIKSCGEKLIELIKNPDNVKLNATLRKLLKNPDIYHWAEGKTALQTMLPNADINDLRLLLMSPLRDEYQEEFLKFKHKNPIDAALLLYSLNSELYKSDSSFWREQINQAFNLYSREIIDQGYAGTIVAEDLIKARSAEWLKISPGKTIKIILNNLENNPQSKVFEDLLDMCLQDFPELTLKNLSSSSIIVENKKYRDIVLSQNYEDHEHLTTRLEGLVENPDLKQIPGAMAFITKNYRQSPDKVIIGLNSFADRDVQLFVRGLQREYESSKQ